MAVDSTCNISKQWVVEIDEVLLSQTSGVRSCHLVSPQPRQGNDIHALQVSGWVAGNRKFIGAVDVMCNNSQLRRIAVAPAANTLRARLRNTIKDTPQVFTGGVGTLGLPPHFEIRLHVVSSNSQKIDSQPFAILRGKRAFLDSPEHAKVRPLLLTALGRSGTTWVMHLLAQQPEIVLFRHYPYESRMAVYSMQMLKVLSEPGNPQCLNRDIATRDTLQTIGPNPYYDEPEMSYPLLRLHCGKTQAEQLGVFCCNNIDRWYEQLAVSQEQREVQYFAEKCVPNHVPWLMRELYPQMREVILVRDFRDLIASATAFNAKRGSLAFGRNRVRSDAEYVTLIAERALEVLNAVRARSQQSHFMRYEDLIQKPEEELSRLLQYLNLDSSPRRVQSTLERAREDSPELQNHRTSANPQISIGRWKRDLDPKLQRLCEQRLGPILTALGYEV